MLVTSSGRYYVLRSLVVIQHIGRDTYNQPKTIAIAGAPVTMHSVLQSLIRYATPAKAIRDSVQQYHKDVPIRLRCRVPTSSVSSTKKDIEPPAWENNEINNRYIYIYIYRYNYNNLLVI